MPPHQPVPSRGGRGATRGGDLGLAPGAGDMGLSVGIENTHPFTDGSVAFAHNGSVLSSAALDGLVEQDVTRLRRGTTDSERLPRAPHPPARGQHHGDAFRDTVDEIAGALPLTSLNCLLLTRTS